MAIRYRRLRNRMKAQGWHAYELAKELNVTAATMSRKLNGTASFTEDEIEHLCVLLNIPSIQVHQFFFEHLAAYETAYLKIGGTN